MKPSVFVSIFLLWGSFTSCEKPKPADYAMYVNIEDWTHKFQPSSTKSYPIKLTNRMKWDFNGEVEINILAGKDTLIKEWESLKVPKGLEDTVWISVQMPEAEGTYEVVAIAEAPDGHLVKSRRIIEVDEPITLP
ncbi:MAG: hypothetical protein AAF694_04345 [Bacteroidota bacterium]